MKCIYCAKETKVTNSRAQKRLNQVWRRRRCQSCNSLFTTTEGADYYQSMRFVDKTGALQPFIREKLFISLYSACGHRSSAVADAQALCATIVSQLAATATNATVERAAVIDTTLVVLGRFDTVAATQYRAYHPL